VNHLHALLICRAAFGGQRPRDRVQRWGNAQPYRGKSLPRDSNEFDVIESSASRGFERQPAEEPDYRPKELVAAREIRENHLAAGINSL